MGPLGIQDSLLGLSSLLVVACGYDNGSNYHYVDSSQTSNPQIYTSTIDANATLENVNPGEGVGLMIEYNAGGTWRIQFTCDTATTNLECDWQLDAQTLDGSSIGGIDVQGLDNLDEVTQKSADVILYEGLTTTELDQFSFQAEPGKPIGFDVWLQNEAEPNRYVFWIGDGWLNRGISGTSFNLHPNTP